MFGYQGGESDTMRLLKTIERSAVRTRWPFLTTLDLSTIHSEGQLASMVKDRSGSTQQVADENVHAWMRGYSQRIGVGPLDTWESEGGSPTAPDLTRSATVRKAVRE